LLLAAALNTIAAPPVVKTVPWVAVNPLIPHDTWSGKPVILKGTSDVQGPNIEYRWDFGDGEFVTGIVTDRYAIEATHAYSAAPGTVFTATLTVRDTTTSEATSEQYYLKIEPQTLQVEVNVAIDNGLWALHKLQNRYSAGGIDYGSWNNIPNWTPYFCTTPANLLAFQVNGHLENGPDENPYTETVARATRQALAQLVAININLQAQGDPDSNGNGIGIRVNQGNQYYQTGMYMDALIASGAPDRIAAAGGPNIVGRSYRDIVQDMVDFYAWGQHDNPAYGGWRYGDHEFPDNSACQWAAIGLIPAERIWNCVIPAWLKPPNLNWLNYSRNPAGWFGYNSAGGLVRGPFATTPSAMVQLAWQGVGRGSTLWDGAESFLRNNFENAGNYNTNIKAYYYGLFAFVKAMLLHDSDQDGVAEPISFLQSSDPARPPIDWYAAQAPPHGGDLTDGVARTLVNDQNPDGLWRENASVDSLAELSLNTPWAIVMLQRSLFEQGSPVAVAKASPNPAVAGQIIQLDGSDSFHQDATKVIDSWEWDLDNDGSFDVSGPFPTVSFPALGNYPVTLRVTDNGVPEASATATLIIVVSTPPLAPTAVAGGPYSFCPQTAPWYLDGLGSTNPDEGQSEPGQPGDTIVAYEWDLNGDGDFSDATGPQPDVTGYFSAAGPGSYLIQLRVTDRTAVSFPSSAFGDLSDTDAAVVVVHDSADAACACIDDLIARPKAGKIALVWAPTGAHHYNVYRGTASGGPYQWIGVTDSSYATYLDAAVSNGATYYYVIRPADLANVEACQSNEAQALPRMR
jgi:hypothetical protein